MTAPIMSAARMIVAVVTVDFGRMEMWQAVHRLSDKVGRPGAFEQEAML